MIFWPQEDNEKLLGFEVPYLSAIGALMYFASNTRLDITFSVNLLARYSCSPTKDIRIELSKYFVIFEGQRLVWVWLMSMTHHIQETCGLSFS